MDNGDATQGHAMTPQEFAKLMGAYPQPAENPLPAYGGYMDNSDANFSWVQNNDYFGADDYTDEQLLKVARMDINKHIDNGTFYVLGEEPQAFHDGELDGENFYTIMSLYSQHHEDEDKAETILTNMFKKEYPQYLGDEYDAESFGAETFEAPLRSANEMKEQANQTIQHRYTKERVNEVADVILEHISQGIDEASAKGGYSYSLGVGGRENEFMDKFLDNKDDKQYVMVFNLVVKRLKEAGYVVYLQDRGDGMKYIWRIKWGKPEKNAETFEAETLHEKGDYRIIAENDDRWDENWTDSSKEMAEEYGVYTLKVQKKVMGGWETIDSLSGVIAPDYGTDSLKDFALTDMMIPEGVVFEAPYGGAGSLMDIGKATPLADFTDEELTTSSAIHGDFDQASLNYSGHQNLEVRAESESYNKLHGWATTMLRDVKDLIEDLEDGAVYDLDDCRERLEEIRDDTSHLDAEMEMIDDSNARIRNRFGDEIGMVAVDDHEIEDAIVEVSDGSDMIQEVIVSESETKKSSMIPLALGAVAAIIAFPKVTEFFTKTEEKASETPELIENPNTGNLDPAQYEEMVVESTGYAVDVIPQVLDGSFMGSRFAALPTERYVDYNEPGIGAHTDIALDRNEMYLEPEMAMVQASENVIKESQAPGQSPYNSTTGEENPDFDMRVLKETQVISLDPAAKPFIPQSMSGYTGNANTPPSVMNKMFNLGVLGQTPAFVPGTPDIGASRTGSRTAIPNSLGFGGSVGGPLSDQVNSSYTDGTTSMSLAQWAIENTVSQTSDTEAVVIDRSSGAMKRVRRV